MTVIIINIQTVKVNSNDIRQMSFYLHSFNDDMGVGLKEWAELTAFVYFMDCHWRHGDFYTL